MIVGLALGLTLGSRHDHCHGHGGGPYGPGGHAYTGNSVADGAIDRSHGNYNFSRMGDPGYNAGFNGAGAHGCSPWNSCGSHAYHGPSVSVSFYG